MAQNTHVRELGVLKPDVTWQPCVNNMWPQSADYLFRQPEDGSVL